MSYSECPTPYSRVSYSKCPTPYSRVSYCEWPTLCECALLHIDTIRSPAPDKNLTPVGEAASLICKEFLSNFFLHFCSQMQMSTQTLLAQTCECSVQSCLFVQSRPENFFCAMSGKFVQCWRGICSNRYYQNINRFKIKVAEKWCYSDDVGFFLCNVVWSLLGNIAQSFCLYNVAPRVLWHYWTGFFHGQHCTSTTLHKVFNCAMLSQNY